MNTLERSLAALQSEAASPHAVEHAQIALERRLAGPLDRAAAVRRPRLAFAAALGAVAVTALVLLPSLVTKPASAFADVQRALADVKFVEMTIVTMQQGAPLNRMQVLLDHEGRTRTTIDDHLTIVTDLASQRMLMLDHRNRSGFTVATAMPKPARDTQWLDELRRFQGQATPIGSRIVDGRALQGYRLVAPFGSTELWADVDDLPVEMTVDAGAAITMTFAFDFTPELAPDAFSTTLPPGYSHAPAGE